jgi:hypothetical protein
LIADKSTCRFVRIWPNPAEAGQWIQEVLGENIMVLNGAAPPNPETIPGKGLRPKIEELEPLVREALLEVYDHNDFSQINNFLALPRISGRVADGLRALPRVEATVLMGQLVSEMALMEALERLNLIQQMIKTALYVPDLQASPIAGAAASKIVYASTFPGIDRITAEIIAKLELRQRTMSPTILAILDRASAARKSGRAAMPGVTHKEERVE